MPRYTSSPDYDMEILNASNTLKNIFITCPLFERADYKFGKDLSYADYYTFVFQYYLKEVSQEIKAMHQDMVDYVNSRAHYYKHIIPLAYTLHQMNQFINCAGEESFPYTECTENIT